jgi:hypothetical protein
MSYEKQTWVNRDLTKPLNDGRMNHIEDGIFEAAATADAAQVAADLDDDTATLVGDVGTATGAALSASYSASFNGLQDFDAKARSEQVDLDLLTVGDSTLDVANGAQTWGYDLADLLHERYPAHDIYTRAWNTATDTAWLSETLIHNGTGSKKITVWLGGHSGMNWRYFFTDSLREAFWKTPTPEAVIICLGHNDADGDTSNGIWARNLLLIEWARTLCPRAQFILSSQNPRSVTPGRAETRNDLYRRMARERGFGYINVTQAFHDDGRDLSAGGPLIDALGVHPTALAIEEIWTPLLRRYIHEARNAPVTATSAPSITLAGRALASVQLRPIASNGWTLTNCAETEDYTVKKAPASSSVKITKNTASNVTAYIEATLSVDEVKGRSIFVSANEYIPTASVGDLGQIWVLVNGALSAFSIVEGSRDQWVPVGVSADIPITATSVTVRFYINSAATTALPALYLDAFSVFVGSIPLEAARTPTPAATLVAQAKASALKALRSAGGTVVAENMQVNAGAEQDAVGATRWFTGGNGSTPTRTTDWAATGLWSWRAVCNSTLQDDRFGTTQAYSPVALPAEVWSGQATIRNPNAGSRNYKVRVCYLDAAFAALAASQTAATAIAAGASATLSLTASAAPALTAYVALQIQRDNSGGAGGDIILADDLILVKAGSLPTGAANADTADNYYYSGLVGLSSSIGVTI